MNCSLTELCAKVACLDSDVNQLWKDTYGIPESNFVAIGNVGVPVNTDRSTNPNQFNRDAIEYAIGAAVVNSMNPSGLFIVGGENFDNVSLPYPIYNQESKVTAGFADLYIRKKVYPVMGQYDYYPAAIAAGDLETKMASTMLHMFPYLPDAKRYYSIYDDKSDTEFYILSSGRARNYTTIGSSASFVYPDDISLLDEQHDWLVQRTSSTVAKNRVVIFVHPFVGIVDVYRGFSGEGDSQVFEDFYQWDFESMGIKLIINGHSGNSYHLRKGTTNIVNCSAFMRSRMGMAISDNGSSEPPTVETTFGHMGYSIEYFSHQPMGTLVENVIYPDPPEALDYIVPKNEILHLVCTKQGITCQFISYNAYSTSQEQVLNSKVIEHSFEISSL